MSKIIRMRVTMVENKKQNKNALVTGASSGIGLCVSNMLLKKGYNVYGIGRNFNKMDTLTEQVCMQEGFHPITLDVTNTPELLKTIQELKKVWISMYW